MIELASLGYFGLFLAAFLAATVLPFSSEVVFGALQIAGFNQWGCIISASVGNFLGGLTCYWIGHLGKVEWVDKYLKIKEEKVVKTQRFLEGRGAWVAFFVFLPGIGDVIAVAMGFMRANIWIVSVSMFLGKFIRYVVVYWFIDLF